MAATQYPAQTPEEPSEAAAPASTEPLLLEQSPATSDPHAPIKLNVTTSEPVSLYDRLGPSIVSSDGTLSRIGNWAEMGEAERDRVLRVLGARNKTRLEERKAVVEREEADKRAKE